MGAKEGKEVTILESYICFKWPTVQEIVWRVIDCTLSCGSYSFNGKCSIWQHAWISVCACMCEDKGLFSANSFSWNRFDFGSSLSSSAPPLVARALGWLVGSLLSVAHPRLPASLITQASDSLIERSQFMNIFQPWLKRQVVLAWMCPNVWCPLGQPLI